MQLPNVGITIGEYVNLVIAGLGLVIALVLGGYFAFLIIRRAMRWAANYVDGYLAQRDENLYGEGRHIE